MYCPRCGKRMAVSRRTYHKQRKWTCPKCRQVRMERIKK